MARMRVTIGLVGIALAASPFLPDTYVGAAGPQTATRAVVQEPQRATTSGPAAAAPNRALLNRYCVTCHNERLKTAGLMLDKVDVENVGAHAEILEKIVRKLRSGQMPPEGRPRPDLQTTNAFATALETSLDQAAATNPDPGRVAVRRLNRAEYVNAIHDLLALEVDGPALLPADDSGFGFDNNGDALSITPALLARYMSAATKISRLAVGSPENRSVIQLYKPLEFAEQDARMGEDLPFATHGGVAVTHTFPLDGEYVFKLRLQRGQGAIRGIEEDEHEIEVRVDHALLKRFRVGGQFKGPDPGDAIGVPEDDLEGQRLHHYRTTADEHLEVRVPVKAGTRVVAATFTDFAPAPYQGVGLRGSRGRTPAIDTFEISGPYNPKAPEDTPSRRRIFICRPASSQDEEPCAKKIIGTLARRAYRRPVTDTDVQPLLNIYREGRSERDFDAGIERALEAMLSLPKFVLRVEREPAGASSGTVYRLSDLELASRLSFFLWKSVPDDELLDVAARGKLKDAAVLMQQVRRMLADRRATRWMTDFMSQWLLVRNMQSAHPDPLLFPDFDDTLREAMVRETDLFFESQVREDRPIPDLLTANYTYLNERLARHYGIPKIYDSHFRRVTLTDERRQGLMGQGSILTVTSYAHRTSVVLRGKWVLETLLGAPPPPPPPNVPPLKENDAKSKPTSLRERMEQHRSNPVCASCHAPMDPLGFALENFDATGRWRETDSGSEINSTVTLSDGTKIDSPKAFREAVVGRGDEFIRTVTEKLLTYALGRGVDYRDAPTVRELVRDVARDDYRWSSLVVGIVKSVPFQMRRAPSAEETGPAATTVANHR
jgi:cytochrome c5